MPILKFTPADLLASEVIESAYYTAEVSSIEGPKASGSGKSINFFVDFSIVEGRYAGKTLRVAFSTGSTNPSLLGVMQWFPYTHFPTLYAAAMAIKDRAKIPLEFDSEEMLHKRLDIRVEKTIADGIPINTIVGFLPAEAGKAQGVPF